MESAGPDFKVRLGTRTYFYNLAQANPKNLFLIDFTGRISLKEVGIHVAMPGASYFEGLRLPEDPFDLAQAAAFLADKSCKDVELLGQSLTLPGHREAFSKKKRLFTFICPNEYLSAETLLAEVLAIYDEKPAMRNVRNYFELDMKKVVAHFDRLTAKIKASLEDKLDAEGTKKEMNLFLAGLRLYHFCAQENSETLLLKSGQRDLLQKYPFFDKNRTPNLFFELQREQALPNEIIVDSIFLGNGKHVSDSNIRLQTGESSVSSGLRTFST